MIILYKVLISSSLVAQMVKNPPTMQETQVQPLGQEEPLEKEMATHSIFFLPGESHGYMPLYSSQRNLTQGKVITLVTHSCLNL